MKKEVKFALFRFNGDYNSKYFNGSNQFEIKKKKLRNFDLMLPSEKISIKEKLSRFAFNFQSKGSAEIWFIQKNDVIAHKSLCVSKCSKFPFMNDDDYVIGPCYTNPDFRGQGLYPSVIASIISEKKQIDKSEIYMIIADSNIASINGVEKVGFEKVGTIVKQGFGVYMRSE